MIYGVAKSQTRLSNRTELKNTKELIFETETNSQRTDLWLPRERGSGGGIDWEFGFSKCKLLHQFSSVSQLCPTLCNPMDHSTPSFHIHDQLPELAQTNVHRVNYAIQPPHPLWSPSLPAFNLSQNQGLFQEVSSSHQVAKGLEFQLQHQSFQ